MPPTCKQPWKRSVASADLAPLLFDCDQFVGFSYNPLRQAETSAQRVLQAFLHGRPIDAYSIADAEYDGGGQPFIFQARSIALTDQAKPVWDELNGKYLRLRAQAMERYPSLREATSFWEALCHILAHDIAAEEAQLISWREAREQITVAAKYKGSLVEQLLSQPSEEKPLRCLILDYRRQWTDVLAERLTALGLRADELIADERQRAVWSKFASGVLDVLFLSDVPDAHLVETDIHQLIIMTPLHPLHEVVAVIDWALETVRHEEAQQIDLLYVDCTPDQQAMLALTDACFSRNQRD